jgi:predicted AlkP superfamily phosphohydrolase/phosphomutase
LKKVVVVGLDGLEPRIVEPLLAAGRLPALAKLREQGGFSRIATTFPAQTPVAWSSFSTGTNPGGHGIYDFIRRDPKTYLPDLALSRYEQKNVFMPPVAVNLRGGKTVWELLTAAGRPAVVIRCPCTFPPDKLKGRMLSGMGVPDVRGGLGTSTFYTTTRGERALESEHVIEMEGVESGSVRTHLIGPRHPKTGEDARVEIGLEIDRSRGRVTIRSDGQPKQLEVREGHWSDWLKVKFKMGMLQSVSGMVRFLVPRLEPFELYASPVNFDATAPMFEISAPFHYAGELQREIGTFYTTGMVEDHTGLNNGRFSESAYLAQCDEVMAERERMLMLELEKMREGLLFCLFDTPDRVQHMFWRFRDSSHPANRTQGAGDYAEVIDDYYVQCDAVVGRVLERIDGDTLLIVLSDHGFNSFRRGLHINSWLRDNGLLALKGGAESGHESEDFLRNVDWDRTKAYALGLGSVYLNVRGREANGIVRPDEMPAVSRAIVAGLTGLIDTASGDVAVRRVVMRDEVYQGAFAASSPDLVVGFGGGYRSSWATGLGGVPECLFEDNTKRWSGDHIIEPSLVPGVLFMNTPFDSSSPRLTDMAPTILSALGVAKGEAMEGHSLLGKRDQDAEGKP